jgi:serine/threonine protein kinase
MVEECVRAQREMQVTGVAPIPRLGELLVQRGYLTQHQVIEALAEQDKAILWCPRCGIRVNVKRRNNVEAYKCARCEGTLTAPPGDALSVADSSIILVSREPLPEEVITAQNDSSKRFGKYILLSEIGRGAVGVVHRAWDTYLHQYVALKLIKPPSGVPAEGDTWRETRVFSLLKEARSAVRLRHPNIVTIYDVGRVHREYYISMEYLQGATLAELIKAARDGGQVSPFYENPKRWLHCLRDIARAVHFAHTRPSPVVHCDLKPSNLFVDHGGRGYVLDFGLAKDLRSMERDAAGTVRGTPSYMAPEQASGRVDDIDPRTDVYGLGSILFELLTGRPPFIGDLVDVLHKVVTSAPERPSQVVSAPVGGDSSARLLRVPPDVEEIALRCLEKDPIRRYQTAKELAEALDRCLRESKTQRREKVTASEPPPPPPASKSGFVASIAAAAVIAGIVGYAIGGKGATPDDVRRDLDAQAASFRPDLALKNYRTLTGDDIDRAVGETEWIDRLQRRLVDELNRHHPMVERVTLRSGALGRAEVLKATNEGIVVLSDGRVAEIGWPAVDPKQVVAFAERLLASPEPADRYALGLYCHRNGMAGARAWFESLAGTSFETSSRRYLAK